MGRWTERRALYNEDDESFDPYLSLDVNEYLIDHYPMLSLKSRRSVWSSCQNDDDFDYSAIEHQINQRVRKLAVKNMTIQLPPNEQVMVDLVRKYLEISWEDVPADDYDDLVDVLIDGLDALVEEYYEDEDEEEETEE